MQPVQCVGSWSVCKCSGQQFCAKGLLSVVKLCKGVWSICKCSGQQFCVKGLLSVVILCKRAWSICKCVQNKNTVQCKYVLCLIIYICAMSKIILKSRNL
jgi:hypothetical protein